MRGEKQLSQKIPTESECLEILNKVGCNSRVITHCCIVKLVAEEMLSGIEGVNIQLVIAGALLHDIGRASDNSIRHAIVGADMIKDMGYSSELVNIVKKHTGAGLDEEDAHNMGLPPGEYIPQTIEEKIVAHSDNLVSDNRIVHHTHSVGKLRNKGAITGAERIINLHIELSKLYGADLDTILKKIGEYPIKS